ncbi:hypothetical protein [Deinococcus sp. YIM 77859]|nr:hypothetical protein [Deinococcus sp. YIM 77859]
MTKAAAQDEKKPAKNKVVKVRLTDDHLALLRQAAGFRTLR